MQELNSKVEKLLNKTEENLKEAKNGETIKKDLLTIINLFYDEINNIKEEYDKKLDGIIMHEKLVSKKLINLEKNIAAIEKDIYEDESDEMEIICPYCNSEVSIDILNDNNQEVKCPECNNIIELFFDNEDDCCSNGNCNHDCSCGSDCNNNDDDNNN